ncbi:MAG: VanZ family protein [bacterium]
MTSKKKAIYWMPAAAWAVGIFCLSLLRQAPDFGPDFEFKDKVGHWAMYCGLSLLVWWALRRAHNVSLSRTFWLAIVIASTYGATDEWHQSFVPGRTCDVWDWASDTAGAVAGAAAAAAAGIFYESRRRARRSSPPETSKLSK